MPTSSGLGTTPGPDGAFERFLSAAIATIITIMFSWRLLLELNEEENTSVFHDRMEKHTVFTPRSSELTEEVLSERECDNSSDESENGDVWSIERGVYDPVGVSFSERQIMDLELDNIQIKTDDQVYERSSDTDDTGSAKSVCSQESVNNTWKDYSWEEDLYDSCIHTRRTFKDFISKDDTDILNQTHSFLTQSDFMATPNFLETRNPPNSPDVVLQAYADEASSPLQDKYAQSTSFSSVETDSKNDDYEVEIIDSDEELYYTSILEPIIEEDSDDLSSSESDSDDKQTCHNAIAGFENLLIESKLGHVQLNEENNFIPDRTHESRTEDCLVSSHCDPFIEPPFPFRDEIKTQNGTMTNISALSPRQDNDAISLALTDTNNNVNPVSFVSGKDKYCPSNLKTNPSSPPESIISSPGSSLPPSPVRTYAIYNGPDDSFSDDSCSSASVITVASVKTSSDDGDMKYSSNTCVEEDRKVFYPGVLHKYEDIYHLRPAQENDIPLIHSDKTENVSLNPILNVSSNYEPDASVKRKENSVLENNAEITGISENKPTSNGKLKCNFGNTRPIDFSDCPDQPREITSSDEDDLYLLDQESDEDSFYLLIGGDGNLRNFDTFANLKACGLSASKFSDADSSSAFDDNGQRFVFSRVEDVDTNFQKIQYITDRLPPNKSHAPVVISDDEKSWASQQLVNLEHVESSRVKMSSSPRSDHGLADDNYELMKRTDNRSIRTDISTDMTIETQCALLDQNVDSTDPDGKNINLPTGSGEVKDIVNESSEKYQLMQINYKTAINNKSPVLTTASGSLQPSVITDSEQRQTRSNIDVTHNKLNCTNIDGSNTTTESDFSNISNNNQITSNSSVIDTHTSGKLTTQQFVNTEEPDIGVLVDTHFDEKQHCIEENSVQFVSDPALILYDRNELVGANLCADTAVRQEETSGISLDYNDQVRDNPHMTKTEAAYRKRPLSADCSQKRIPVDFSRYGIDRQTDHNADKLYEYDDVDTAEILKPVEDCLASSLGYWTQYSTGGSTTKSIYPNETGVNTISMGKVIRAPVHLPSDLKRNLRSCYRNQRSKLPYRSILQQHVSPASLDQVVYKIPDKELPASRQRIIATRNTFLSDEDIASESDSYRDKFQEHKHSLTHSSPVQTLRNSTGHLDKDTKLSLSIEKPYSVRHIRDLYSLRHDEIDSQDPPDIAHLHKDCIFSPEKQEEILKTTILIENLRAYHSNDGSVSSLLETDIDSGSSSMNMALLSETELDHHILLQFPLERAYSMNDLGTTRTSTKTGKSRFADRRRHQKSQSLQTLETDLDELFANESEGNPTHVPSVHEIRVTRSLQKLHVPDWYKRSSVSRSGSTQSLFTRRDSTSTMSSFGFIPSLTSSPYTSVTPGSTTVVIKTRVASTNARLLRGLKLPTSPEKSPNKPTTSCIQLPSDKYRKSLKKTELMPIPIVSFSKLREMFEAKCTRTELHTSPSSPKTEDKRETIKKSPPPARAVDGSDSFRRIDNEVKPILKIETQGAVNHVDEKGQLIANRKHDLVKESVSKKPKVNKVSFADSMEKREPSATPSRLRSLKSPVHFFQSTANKLSSQSKGFAARSRKETTV